MKRIPIILILTMVLFGWLSCRQVYNPHPVNAPGNYLVIEGNISTGTDSTSIRLSRTVPLTSKAGTTPELGAIVSIIGEGGASYPCIETGKGYYKAAGLNLPSGNFGLKINTADGKIYQSDLVAAKNSPPIDSVYYRIQNNGIEVYADTHDPSNNTRYYRWETLDTYQFHSFYQSFLYLQKTPIDTIVQRPPGEQVFICWRNDTSSTILINSSARLAKDVIERNPVEFIESTSEKIESRYSLLIKQYALTANAYNYYQQLKKNTEQLGGIFDPQPSDLPGNIHCISNPTEPVLGYITAGASAQTRIYIDNRDLPTWLPVTPYNNCLMDTARYNQPSGKSFFNAVENEIYSGYEISIYAVQPPTAAHPIGYAASTPLCVDCTLRGTNKRPDFWTDEPQK